MKIKQNYVLHPNDRTYLNRSYLKKTVKLFKFDLYIYIYSKAFQGRWNLIILWRSFFLCRKKNSSSASLNACRLSFIFGQIVCTFSILIFHSWIKCSWNITDVLGLGTYTFCFEINDKTQKLLDSYNLSWKNKLDQITNSMISTIVTMLLVFTFMTTSKLTYWLKEECNMKHVSCKCLDVRNYVY